MFKQIFSLQLLSLIVCACPCFSESIAKAGFRFYPDKMNLMTYQDADGKTHTGEGAADWERRRVSIRDNMQLVMGDLPGDEKKVSLDLRVESEEDFPKFTRRKITIAVEGGDRLPALLCIPKGLTAPAPAMLCLHPTSSFGKGEVAGLGTEPNRNFTGELAERGYVTLAPDYPGFGDYTKVDAYAMGYASTTMKGIWNHMRCVDLLQTLPEVDGERIGAIGHSLGGHNALFLGFFDERIKVMVSSCGFNRFAKYFGGDLTGWSHKGYMPRIATHYNKDPAKMPFDWTEVLAGLAPRPVFVNAPLRDANFDVTGVEDCITAAGPVYELFKARDKLQVAYPDCEHDFPPETREQAYAFVDAALKAK